MTSKNVVHNRICDRSFENTSCSLGTDKAKIKVLKVKTVKQRLFLLLCGLVLRIH